MRTCLRFLGKGGSDKTGCPTLYATDRGAYVVQGWETGTSGTVEIPHLLLGYLEPGTFMGVPLTEESEPLRRFLDGESEPGDGYDKSDWVELIETLVGRGVGMRRIRVVTVPHSDYQRWLLSVTGTSVDAGEDIRYVPRGSVDPKSVPSDDWWLFDNDTVAFNLVDTEGRPAGAAVTTDPGIVSRCRSVEERLWSFAVPYRDYIDQVTDIR